MASHDNLIYGERLGDLLPAFSKVARNLRAELDGSFTVEVRLADEEARPMVRALHRAEAQLLIEDADALTDPDVTDRTPEQRRCDAFMCIARGFEPPAVPTVTGAAAAQPLRRFRREAQRGG